MAISKIVLLFGICIFSLFLLSHVTMIDDDRTYAKIALLLGKVLLYYLSRVLFITNHPYYEKALEITCNTFISRHQVNCWSYMEVVLING